MELTTKTKSSLKMKNSIKKKNDSKTLEYLNVNGETKVFDIHRYSNKGVLYFKKENK